MIPKISIITISFNNRETIEHTMNSVFEQSYSNIEYIIIDGNSSDGTMDLVNKNKAKIDLIISEKDKGIYDAMNKGLKNATGDIIGFINADDFLHDKEVINDIAEAFENSKADVVYGNKIYVQPDDISKITRIWKPGNYNRKNFKRGWMPPHLSTYIRASAYQQFGIFNTSFKIAADYELLFRFMYVNKLSAHYIDRNIVYMRAGGLSNSSLKNYWISNFEVYKSWGLNGESVSPTIIFEKPLRKLKQIIR